jgi:HD superfamily phosphodiesterase
LRRDVVILFALLHDACRYDDGHDAEHGLRSGDFAAVLHRDGVIKLDGEGLELLVEACRTHTGGRIPAHPTKAPKSAARRKKSRVASRSTRPPSCLGASTRRAVPPG